ncbi:hypothetical protein SEPCBS119000_000755 [Sporothrix epigloea]|uniref:Set domain containing protein n=1 Tax=Sporothrix epigloea TaxID=1892477 RepID=A0ABP0D6Z8_9PEZI
MEEDLQQRDVPEQENSVQSAVGQLDGSEKSVFMKALQAEARQVDDLQASALLQEARRAEAMQAAEARRAGVLQADDICGRDLLLADTPLGGSRGDWTVEEIASSFEELLKSLLVDHGRNVEYAIDMIKPRTRPACVSFDEFADLPVQDIDASSATTNRILVCGKLYRDNQRRPKTRTTPVRVLPIKSPGRAVPKYRFHHVEIAKNILSPNMPLMFIPHLRDLENNSDDKRKHDQWIEELESMERKSGFDSTKLFQKGDTTRRNEFTKQLSEYLDHWIARLGIDNCSKASLIRYMANESQKSHSITPQQKDSLIDSCGEDSATPRAAAVASMITEAFNRVLKSRDVTLYDVLKQDGAVENVFDPKKASKAKDQDKEASLEQIQQYLGTYTSLKCMICHTHSCEHGEFDAENVRRCFSIDDLGGKLWKYIERRRDRQASDLRTTQKNAQGPLTISSGNSMPVRGEGGSGSGGKAALLGFNPSCKLNDPCKNKCYRSYDVGDDAQLSREWTEDETSLLRSLHMTFGNSTSKVPCTLCPLLGRYCWEVYRRAKELGLRISPCIALPPPADVLPRSPVVKPVSWYDRHRKTLNGDWSDHTHTHLHALREQREPCNHEGPCTAASGCSCVEAKLLCERFCQCTDESCAIKFTGCACHVNGKTCYTRQKEGKPCICVQLNRECDPVLCGSCGARERADPENREYDALHSTGCQNVSLQRGKSKAVVLGQSQLQGCGYGLFTAEDIEADEFIIEYVGELITHDEGVRREARRGDFSDQGANASYLFTLLEQDGIWVDAAIYGNLSRYINHASESDKRGCNITPKVLYVNGEFRIRFMAMRDIRAGEELFFDYGENFPNLTKKLLEDMAFASDDEAMAVIRSAKGRISGRNKGGVSMSSRHGAASRSNSRRRKTRGRPSTSLARSGLSSNGKTGESVNIVRNASRQRRARPRRGDDRGASSAVVEDPLVDEDESDDGSGDDIDHMDLDGSKLQRSHRACKQASQKRRKRLLDGDEVGEDEDGKVHNGRGNSLKRKRRLPVNEDRETEQFYRNGRGRRRSNAKPSLFAVEASTELADLSRRLSSRARTQPAHQEQDKQGRASTNPDSSAASTDVDDDTETDEQPRRKRLRTVTRRQSQSATATDATGVTASSIEHPNPDTDMVNIDSDVQISGRRPLHTGRTRQRNRTVESAGSKWPDYNGNKSEPDRDGLAASTAVHLDTAGKDQGTVLIPGQSHDPQQTEAGNELKENGPTTTTTVRAAKPRRSRNVVPDSDDDLDLGASQPSRNERTAPWSQPPAASPNAHSKSLPPIGTPISRPKTPRNGSGSHGEAHKAVYGVYNSGGGDGHSRRTLRSGEARPDSSLGAPGSRGASSARPPRMCLTPTKSMTRLAGDDESGADSVDRSHRRRQLPARYRSDE